MQTQGLATQLEGRDGSTISTSGRSTTGRLALTAFVVGTAIGAWSGWGLERIVATDAPAPAVSTGTAPIVLGPLARKGAVRVGRSLALTMPADGTYVTAKAIAVAGTAFGRPHGPKVTAVHVELIAGGQPIVSADIPVFSSHFAGVIDLPALDGRTQARLRVSDPLHQGDKALIREVTIDER